MTKWEKGSVFRYKWFIILVLFLIAVQSSFADNTSHIQGVWKLVSYEVETQATGQKDAVMGERPGGYAIFTPERVFFVLTKEGRKPAKTVDERAELLNGMVAYTGMYRIEGDQWITTVDAAWTPEWVGTEQRRSFKVNGDRLQVLTVWRVMPNWPEKGMSRSIITFERTK